MIGGMFGSYNVALAWISSTFARPRAKRAAAYATINSLGNSMSSHLGTSQKRTSWAKHVVSVAQIWSPYLYDKKYSPQYRVSPEYLYRHYSCCEWLTRLKLAFATNTVMAAIAVGTCLVLRVLLARENKAMDKKEAEATNEVELDTARKQIRYVL